MDQLWAPWRLSYVANPKIPATGDDCFFCRGLAGDDDRGNLIAKRTPLSVIFLNRFPYNNGHLLVAPNAHKASLLDLAPDELLDAMEAVRSCIRVLTETMRPEGFNVGLNLGRVAGAGVPGHLHGHVVPRWSGDTNFMPAIADVRVIVQSLEALYDLVTGRL